jgi:hypothetical protein
MPITLDTGQTFSFGVTFLPDAVGLERGVIDIVANDPNNPNNLLQVTGTGLALTSSALHYAHDYVAVEFPNLPGSTVLRTISDSMGNFSFFMPPNTEYHYAIFDPISGLVANGYGQTAPSGKPTAISTPVFLPSIAPDTDGDGLPDDVEFAIGTNPNKADTNGDGIDDFTQILTDHTDPLAAGALPTGIIAQLNLPGAARAVALAGSPADASHITAYVAGSQGLAVVDASQLGKPLVQGMLPLAGPAEDVAVDSTGTIAAVPLDQGRLALVNVAVPTRPSLLRTVSLPAPQQPADTTHVQVAGGVAYVTNGSQLVAVDLATGAVVQTIETGTALTGLAREDTLLYTMDADGNMRVFDLAGGRLTARGTLLVPPANGGGQLTVANGIAYVAAVRNQAAGLSSVSIGGFATVDVSDPDHPLLIAGTGVALPATAPSTAVVGNGSGLALAVGAVPSGSTSTSPPEGVLDVMNVSDPTTTTAFLTRFVLPDLPSAEAIGAGIAYVADGSGGLLLIHYRPFDTQGQPPAIRISTQSKSTHVTEGDRFPVLAQAGDDVQIRTVELLVNGQVVQTSLALPFNLEAVAPLLAPGSRTITVQARATDTGGNTTLSNVLTLQLLPKPVSTGDLLAVEGQTASGVVATFPDTNPGTIAADYQATIDWGDGTPVTTGSVDAVTRPDGPSFTVSGSHQFQGSGPTLVTVILTDNTGTSVVGQTMVTVRPDVSGEVIAVGLGGPINPQTQRLTSSGTLTNVSGSDIPGPLYLVVRGLPAGVSLANADGTTVDGFPYHLAPVPSLPSGQTFSPFVLEFSDPSLTPFAYSVETVDGPGGPAPPAGSGVLQVTNNPFVATEGAAFTGTVATFTDTDGDLAGNFTATITWGDGATSAGTVTSAGPGRFVVTGSHTYAGAGPSFYGVRIQDADGTSGSATGTAAGPAPGGSVLYHVTVDTSALAGTSGFLDFQFNPGALTEALAADAAVTNFSTTSGGATGAATFGGDASGSLAGTLQLDNRTTLNEARQGFTFGSQLSFDVRLSGPALTAPARGRFGSTFALSLLGPDGTTPLESGDPSGAVARIAVSPGGATFELANGVASPPVTQVAALGTANVLDAVLKATQVPIHPVEGRPFTSVVATFTDANPLAAAGDFSATVVWGDGTPASTGTVTAAPGGGFQVSAGHTYAEAGSYVPRVRISDRGGSAVDAATAVTARVTPPGGFQARLSLLENLDVQPPSTDFPSYTSHFAVGDLNGDGKLDVVGLTDGPETASRTFPTEVEVALGNGDGTYQAPTVFDSGNRPGTGQGQGQGFVALDDVNGDGKLDLVTAGGVFLGNGDGTFGPLKPFPVDAGANPVLVLAGDFNGDGKPDLVIADRGASGPDTVLLGNGDGTFHPAPVSIGLDGVSTLVAGDFNGDGKLDLVITVSTETFLALGKGDGTFQDLAVLSSNFTVHAAADLNGDGKPDLVGDSGGQLQVWLGNGDGTFRTPVNIALGTDVLDAVAGDFNGDGKVDLAVRTDGVLRTVASTLNTASEWGVILLLGHGDGNFTRSPTYAATVPSILDGGGISEQLVAGDFNGDGTLDVALTESTDQVGVLLGNGDGTLVDMVVSPRMPEGGEITAGDYNGNGRAALLSAITGAPPESAGLTEVNVAPDGTLVSAQPILIGAGPYALTGDFNGDGKPDLVTGDGIALGNGDGTFGPPSTITADPTMVALAEGDFNGDGKPDLVMTDAGSNPSVLLGSVLLGNGDGTFRPSGFGTFQAGDLPARNDPGTLGIVTQMVVADLNGDGKPDLAVTNFATNTVIVLLGKGDGSFGAGTAYPTAPGPRGITVSDFNGDGKPDLAVAADSPRDAPGPGNVTLLRGNGDGTFQAAVNLSAGGNATGIAAGDFNGDGKPDLAVSAFNFNRGVTVLLGNGDGTFQAPISDPAPATQGFSVVVGDFNGDGKPDLAVSGDYAVSVLLGDGTGSFLPPVSYATTAGNIPVRLVLADVNGDGKLDLLGSDEGGVLLGNGDGTFRAAPVFFFGQIGHVQTADLNRDGKADLLVGGFSILSTGSGTFGPEIPLPPAGAGYAGNVVGDFTGDGIPDVLVPAGFFAPVTLNLLVGNGDGTFRAPVNAGALHPSGDTLFGWVSVGDFNGDGKLDLVAVSTDSSTGADHVETLLGNGDGTFRPEVVQDVAGLFPPGAGQDPFPVVADFNGDGKADLALAVADISESAGEVAILLGNGDGTYQAPRTFALDSSARAQIAGDFNGDGKQDLAVADTNSVLHLFLGNGDGTFRQIAYDIGGNDFPAGLAAADFTGDGVPGLGVTYYSGSQVALLLHGPTPSAAALVADAPLTASGTARRATRGSAFTSVVATFTDADPNGSPGDYTASITWGDGHTSAGAILADGHGGFVVVGTNTYGQTGSFSVTVNIGDQDGATTQASDTINVGAGPDASLTATGIPITATAAVPFTGPVAHFTDADPTGTASDFLATIMWGDGQTSLGTVTASGGGFDITGTNTYAAATTYTLQVVITDSGGATATVQPTATVLPNPDPPLTATGLTLHGTAATPFTGTVATFTDVDPAGNVSQYTATITWGDGQVSTGTVMADASTPGQFDIVGTNTYVAEKTYAVSVLITDMGGASATAGSTALVADAPLTATGFPIAGTAGTAITALVATFRDTDLYGQLADYSATVDWGDHHTSPATVTADPLVAGLFDVSATHTYDSGGSYILSTAIADKGGATVSAPGSALVAAAPLMASGVTVGATEQVPFSGVVANFTDAASGASAGSFKALIAWGDGHTTPGTVTAGTSGFQVTGTNTYAARGAYAVQVFVLDAGGSTVTVGSTAQVTPPPLQPVPATITATAGAVFTGTVASFIDPNASHPVGYYAATITWGDGQVSAGTVTPDALQAGGFRVLGSNRYAREGSYGVSVAVHSLSGVGTAIASTAAVADAPLTATGANTSATEGTPFTGILATFTDADPGATPSDFSAAITWGDGKTSPGTIVPDPLHPGTFEVQGTTTYAEEGIYSPDVVLHDTGGAEAEAGGSVLVGDAALQATETPGTASARAPFTAPVATLVDANPSAAAGDFTITIAWGDGHSSPGTLAAVPGQPGQFTIQGTSTYDRPGSYDVTATVTDRGGARVTAQTTRQVANLPDAPLTATGTTLHAAPATAALLPVAAFHDADPSGTLSDFTAQATWGDQHVSAGLVISDPNDGSRFLVLAGNTYAADGTYPVQVAIADRGGAVAVAQGEAVVGSGISPAPGGPAVPAGPPGGASPPAPAPVPRRPELTIHDGILTVVAPPSESVQVEFRVLLRQAAFHNELGLILLNATGQIDGLGPADPGFLRRALRNRHRRPLFGRDQGPGARRVLTVHGGDQLLFYLVQNATTGDVLRSNPSDSLVQEPLVFLSTKVGNPDGQSHTRIRRQGRNAFVLSWEDMQSPGSDRDFNDAIVSVGLLRASTPRSQR